MADLIMLTVLSKHQLCLVKQILQQVWKWKAYTGSHGTTGLRLNPLKTDTVMNTSQFTDESGTGHTVTTSGDTHHRYDLSKFANNPSIYFDGSGDKLAIPDHSDFDFGTGDFTVEFCLHEQSIRYLSYNNK